MIALGNNVHIFARPARREALSWLFETVLQCGPVATVEHPGMVAPMLLVRCSQTMRRLVMRPVAEKSMAVVPVVVR